jgi:hypothetical protein
MALRINRASYYYTMVQDRPGEAYRMLSQFSTGQVNLLAFNAIPMGPNHTQLALFPEDSDALLQVAEKAGLVLTGPHRAFLVQGDDELGALVDIHGALFDANINVVSSNGVTDGKSSFGYIVYVRQEDFERAAQVLGADL